MKIPHPLGWLGVSFASTLNSNSQLQTLMELYQTLMLRKGKALIMDFHLEFYGVHSKEDVVERTKPLFDNLGSLVQQLHRRPTLKNHEAQVKDFLDFAFEPSMTYIQRGLGVELMGKDESFLKFILNSYLSVRGFKAALPIHKQKSYNYALPMAEQEFHFVHIGNHPDGRRIQIIIGQVEKEVAKQ